MKKLYIILIVGILLVGIIGAVAISEYINRDKEISKSDKDLLADYGITDYEVQPIICNTETCNSIKIKIDGVVDKRYTSSPYWENCTDFNEKTTICDGIWERVYYTSAELEAKRDVWEDRVISQAIAYLREKEAKELLTDEEKVVGADVTIIEEK